MIRYWWVRRKLALLCWVARRTLPTNVYLGRSYNPFSGEWPLRFGTMDNRGVLQGLAVEHVEAMLEQYGTHPPEEYW